MSIDSASLFDHVAVRAMQGILSGGVAVSADVARDAFAMAEAMRDEKRRRMVDYNSPEKVKARNLAKLAPDLLEGVRLCLKAEKDRRKKLKIGSPASTYSKRRIEYLEELIIRAGAG